MRQIKKLFPIVLLLLVGLVFWAWIAPFFNTDEQHPIFKQGCLRLQVVLAHADDEVVNAGLIRHMANLGCKIELITLTDGSQNPNSDLSVCVETDIRKCRKREVQHSAKILGIDRVWTPFFPDAFLIEHVVAASAFVAERFREFQPEMILTVEPSGLNRLTDHQAAHQITVAALKQSGYRPQVLAMATMLYPINLGLKTMMPESWQNSLRVLPLTRSLVDCKIRSAYAHPSQASTIRGLTAGLGPEILFSWMNKEGFYMLGNGELEEFLTH